MRQEGTTSDPRLALTFHSPAHVAPSTLDELTGYVAHMLAATDDIAPFLAVATRDPVIGPLVRAAPGRRVPGVADPNELAIRAVLGQQVSLAGAATLAGRLVADCGVALEHHYPEMTDSLLVCVTETAKKESIDGLVRALSQV